MTGIYALVHMAVDLSCAFLVYTYVLGGEQWYLWLLLYNFCAFALQMPIGAAADRLDRNSCVAVGAVPVFWRGCCLELRDFRPELPLWPELATPAFMWEAGSMS